MICPKCSHAFPTPMTASDMGKKSSKSTSELRKQASRENGKKFGGRSWGEARRKKVVIQLFQHISLSRANGYKIKFPKYPINLKEVNGEYLMTLDDFTLKLVYNQFTKMNPLIKPILK